MKVKLDDVIARITGNVDRFNTDLEYYVGGEHMETGEYLITKRGLIEGSTIGPMFYFGSQAVIDLCSPELNDAQIFIGQLKIVRSRIIHILRPVGKDHIDVDDMLCAIVGFEGCVVYSGIGNAGCSVMIQVGDSLIGRKLVHRAVVHAVHGFYHTG